LDAVVRTQVLQEEHREQVRNALLLKHVHQHEKEFQKTLNSGEKKQFPLIRSLADMGKKASSADMRGSETPPQQIPSSNLLTANDSRTSLKQATQSQATFDLGGSVARINTSDSKPKVFS
jgi:hypothetical protein